MTPILYEKDEIDFTSQGLGSLVEIYDVDVAEQRNGLLQLTASYPVTGVRYSDISVGRIILAKPNQRDEPHAFRITSTDLDIMGHNVMIEADSITYDLNHNIVKHVSVNGQSGQAMMTALQMAVVNPSIFTFYSDITHVSSTSLDYVNPMEAVMGVKGSFLQIWGGDLKRENRRVAMFNRRGRDNVATFRLGKNISGLKYKVDISSLVTRILPIKTVQENDATTYLEGTPVSSQYINSYEQIYTIKVDFTDDTIKTVDDLNKASANWFVDSANTARDKPSVTIDIDVLSLQDSADYQDKFKDLESVALTDTVTVYVPEYGINVTAIVNELHFDPIQERVTKLTVGTAKQSFADSSRTQLSDLQDKIISVQNQADATAVSANGKSTNYYGSVEPSHPQGGDTWFWVDGDKSGIKVFVDGDWVEPVDSDTQEKIEAAVDDALTQANAYSDQLVADNASQINTVLDDVQAKQADLTAQQAELDTKAQGYANKALADAKADTLATATQTAKDAQDALDSAKTTLTTSLNKEVTDRTNAVSALDTKAQGYADTAKTDTINAATTADGVINKKIDDTASSITTTISQNKVDADGKITTAQSTATQALNGLATKVSQTVYDAKTGQLQTDLNTTTTTANQAKTDIVAIKSDNTKQDARMTTIESDANGTKTTVSNLQTDLGKANGSISTLQQRADGFDATVTKVNNLSVGGRNLLLGTATPWVVKANASNNWNFNPIYDHLKGGTTYTFSAEISVSNGQDSVSVGAFDASIGTRWAFSTNFSKGVKRGSFTFTTPDRIDNDGHFIIYAGTVEHTAGLSATYTHMKLEEGNVPTAWTPAPEDLSSATTQAQLTADNATLSINNYKTDADGRISKAQADIIVNANAITQKVSQSDYNAKTGDLTTKVNTAQSTADSATSTIGAYKTANDARVASAESKITANATAITQKVSQTDYNTKTGQIDGQISTINQTAGKISQSVADVTTKVNNLQQVNLVNNSDFSPDLSGWVIKIPTIGTLTTGNFVNVGHNVMELTSTSTGMYRIYSSPILTLPLSGKISYTFNYRIFARPAGGTFYSQIQLLDADLKELTYLNAINYGTAEVNKWNTTTVTNLALGTIPTGAKYITLSLDVRGAVGVHVGINKPMLVNSDNIGDYVSGQYTNNDKISTVSQTVDSIRSIVSDPTTGLTKRVQTAEGTLSQVTGADIPNLQKATYWQPYGSLDFNIYTKQGSFFFNTTSAKTNGPTSSTAWTYLMVEQGTSDSGRVKQTAWYDGVTGVKITYVRTLNSGTWSPWYANDNDSVTTISQTNEAIRSEISNRKTGDENTLTQSKDFTTSSISNSESGMRSQITQTSDAILGKVSETGVRYVRINGQGNQDNAGTHFMRVSLFDSSGKDLLLGKTATVSGPNSPYFGGNNGGNGATDGNVNTYNAIYPEPNTNNFMVYDLGAVTYTSQKFEVKMWTNYRTYKGVTIQVSPDNKSWRTILQEDVKSVSGDITKPDTTINLGGTSSATQLALLKDNWSIGIADNAGALASGIAGDLNGMTLISKEITLDGNTTVTGDFYAKGGNFKNINASNITVGNLDADEVRIINLDVNTLTGDVSRFLETNWDGAYGSTKITSAGMKINTQYIQADFQGFGMDFSYSNKKIGGMGISQYLNGQPGLSMRLESGGAYMAWSARNEGDSTGSYIDKLAWYRQGKPALGGNYGFIFSDRVTFNKPINIEGTSINLGFRPINLYGNLFPFFGNQDNITGFAYTSNEIYMVLQNQYVNLSNVIKALSGLGAWSVPTNIDSTGKVTQWRNVTT